MRTRFPGVGRLAGACLSALVLALPAAAQDAPPVDPADEIRQLREALERERQARVALEQRLSALESQVGRADQDEAEARLRALVGEADLQAAPPRAPSSPSFYNPAIGVFMDAVASAGNLDNELDAPERDRFSLRETEVDFRLPLSPFAEGVAIFTWEDAGGQGQFDSSIEEGYANLSLGGLLDTDWTTTAKLGRFRPVFGRNNALHTHDWLQVFQPLPVQDLLGQEGIVGDGVMFTQPLWHSGDAPGEGQSTRLDLSLVNGDTLEGDGHPLTDLADDADLGLESRGPVVIGRLGHYVELGGLDDVEFGVSHLTSLSNNALQTSANSQIRPSYWDADVTWRIRPDETGIGSWLLQAEALRTDIDYRQSNDPDFPEGKQVRGGWWTTVQRQMTPTVYLGLLYAESDRLGSRDHERAVSPYVTWYADEFFRIRAQLDLFNRDVADGPDINDAYRALLEFTWNFGVHQPHPYWVNK